MIPRVFHPVLPQDYVQRPVRTYKRYSVDVNSWDSSSGYIIRHGLHSNLITPVGSDKVNNDPTNLDGTYKHSIWNQINSMYYKFPYDPYLTFEHSNKRFTYKFLNMSASMLTIPQQDFGEQVKQGSVKIFNFGSFDGPLYDDKNGNLYDSKIDTSSFTPRENLVAYWGFNDAFNKFKYFSGELENTTIEYKSNTSEIDRPSYAKNVSFVSGVPINGEPSGMSAFFYEGSSQIITEHRDIFDFSVDDEFSISFWIRFESDDTNFDVITKKKYVETLTYGNQPKYQNDLKVESLHLSRSFIDNPTPIYPFDITITDNDYINFKRSDGLNTIHLSGSLQINQFTHFCVTKKTNTIYLYKNGTLIQQKLDLKNSINNKHALTFGDLVGEGNFRLDEVRFYNCSLTDQQIKSLAKNTDQSLYQTAVCGNVFYKRGNIVVSGFDPKYHILFNDSFNLQFRSTWTIYENEALIRISPGELNLSQNKTVLKAHNSDLLIDDMVTGSLYPYVTEIGFYDDSGNLLVVGKPNQPIQMRDDVSINISTKWNY